MYSSKTVFYEYTPENTRFIRSRCPSPTPLSSSPQVKTIDRSRSPSPSRSRSSSPVFTSHFSQKPYISFSHFKEIGKPDDATIKWSEITEDKLGFKHDFYYIIDKIYFTTKGSYIFKATVYVLELESAEKIIREQLNLFGDAVSLVSVSNYNSNKYLQNTSSNYITVNVRINSSLFNIFGKDKINFAVPLEKPELVPRLFFDCFRNTCRGDNMLLEVFNDSMREYVDQAKTTITTIATTFAKSLTAPK